MPSIQEVIKAESEKRERDASDYLMGRQAFKVQSNYKADLLNSMGIFENTQAFVAYYSVLVSAACVLIGGEQTKEKIDLYLSKFDSLDQAKVAQEYDIKEFK